MKNIRFYPYIIILMIFCLLPAACSNDGGGSGTATYTYTDTSTTYPNGKYLLSVFKGSTPMEDLSVYPMEALTNGNSVVITGLEMNQDYTFYVWIDSDGDDKLGDNMMGSIMTATVLSQETGVSTSGLLFGTFQDKNIVIAGADSELRSETVQCYWLPAGALTDSVKDRLVSDASQVTAIVGQVTATFPSGDGTV